MFSWAKKKNLKKIENIVASALKSCIEKSKKVWEVFFTGENQFFFRAKNFNVSTKTL
jgi:hypothetical protein